LLISQRFNSTGNCSSAERYDKFDIWNVIADNQIEREWFADLPPLHLGMDIKALSGIK